MKKLFIALCFVSVISFGFFASQAKAMSAKDLSWSCIADGISVHMAEEDGKLDAFFHTMNTFFLLTNVVDKQYSSKELAEFYKKGVEKAEDFGMTYEFIALGAGWDTKYADIICSTIGNQEGLHTSAGPFDYGKNIVFSPYNADLSYSKDALVEEQFDPVNIGYWRANTPVIFPLYIDKTGTYQVSVVYSKRDKNGSRAPLEVSVLTNFSKKILDNAKYTSIDLPTTGTWSKYVEKSLINVRLQAEKTYYIVLQDKNKTPNKFTMNLRNLFVRRID